MDDFAIRVFPSSNSSAMRQSSSVLHYSPIADPPIDYTLHKPKQNGSSKEIPWRIQQPKLSKPQPQPSVYRPALEQQYWPKRRISPNPRSSKPTPAPRRHTIETNNDYARTQSRDTEDETAMVLEDLDTVLDNEELSFEERRSRIEAIALHPYPANAFDHLERNSSPDRRPKGRASSIEKARALSINRHSTPVVPVLNDTIIEDLRKISYGGDIISINEQRKAMVARKYRETERKIEEAKHFYTPEYFSETKFTAPEIPLWKRDLLAKRYSKETISQFEEKAWKEFSEWKKINAPSINLYPPPLHSRHAVL